MVKLNPHILLFALVLMGGLALAPVQEAKPQKKQINYEAEYQKGKNLYQKGQYGLAMQVLKPLTSENERNAYVEYANFYFALAAYKDGQLGLAKNMLLQLNQKFSDWDKMNLVYFWLAKIYFDQENYTEAFNTVSKISEETAQGEKLKAEARAMKDYYIQNINEQAPLQNLLKKFPQDTLIARQLTALLNQQTKENFNYQLLDSLVKAYNFDIEKYQAITPSEIVKKSTYNVGVFLPFMWHQVSFKRISQSNNFVLDLYKGLKMAVDDLNIQGVQIELHAFDTKRDGQVMSEILEREEMKNMDLFIGPLFPGPIRLVNDFSYNYKIKMFNPLSRNPEVIDENPFAYLVNPSLKTIGSAGVKYAIEELKQDTGTVIYGDNSQDSLLAHTYKAAFERDTSKKIKHFVRVTEEDSIETINNVILGRDSTDQSHVFVASNDDLIVANAVSAVAQLEMDSVPIIGLGTMLEKRSLSLDQLERLGVYMLAPDYIDSQNEKFLQFRETYKERFNELPSSFVYRSYDMMMFLGKMLNQFGIYFQNHLNVDGTYPSTFYKGYNYHNARDNQVVPVIILEESELQVVKNIRN